VASGPTHRAEDAALLRGAGGFVDDDVPAGALHAVFVRSPHAHARLRAVEVRAASAAPGVALVLTGGDLLAAGLGAAQPLARRTGPDGAPMATPPRLCLSPDAGRFVGDPVALVVAATRSLAEDAAERVEIDWEPLPAVCALDAALDPDAPRVWPEAPGNVAYLWEAGDEAAVAAALDRAAHVTRLRVAVSRTTAATMEPRGALAEHDAATGRFRLTAGLQAPWQTREILARDVLRVAPDTIEIVAPDVGGSFGMKGQTYPEYGALLHAARLAGRPVFWRSTRSEAMLSDDQGRDVIMEGWLGLDRGGAILALRMEAASALGAYLSVRGTLTTVDNVPGVTGPYRMPAAHARMRGVYSHTPSISPYRGAGRPEASLLIERLIDAAARETGRDPAALRRLNMLTPAELPHLTPLGFDFDSGDFPAVLDAALALGDRPGFAARRAESAARGRLRGLGMASVIARAANGQFEAARLTLHPDGRLALAAGSVSHGQGHATVLPRIAAEALGVAPAAVDYAAGRSELFDRAVGTFGSRTASIAGPAVAAAAEALAAALRPHAAAALGAEPETLVWRDGGFADAAGRAAGLAEIAARLDAPLSAEGRFAPEGATYPNGAHVCEVEVDPETGATEILRYSVVEDVGTVLDPAIVKGQVHGGAAQGLGQALAERVAFDATGQPVTGSFMDFAVPRAADLPAFAVEARPAPTARNPLGVKGAGEGGTIGALPAFQNALADALAAYGLREIPMPATPEAIWRLIRDAAAPSEEQDARWPRTA
jgi:carbon-monoxide dehydrogenase large subunit